VDASDSIEPELAHRPRRPRWRRLRGRLWARLLAAVLLSLPLVAWLLHSTGVFLLAALGTQPARSAWSEGLWLVLAVLPTAGVGLYALCARFLREWWLVRWGRPVRGRVRSREVRGRGRRHVVRYEYAELDGPVRGATLHGTAYVAQADYDAHPPGARITVLHALWNPRVSVAYPFCAFAALNPAARPAPAGGPAVSGSR
jgi:hypothetical protein